MRVEFPGGFGRRTAWRFDFADQVTLPGQLGNPVITAYCMDSRVATTALAAIARIPGGATPALALERRRPARGLKLGGDWWAGSVRAADGTGRWAMGRSQSYGTAVVVAAATDRLTNHPPSPGVHHLNRLVGLASLRDALEAHGIWLGCT